MHNGNDALIFPLHAQCRIMADKVAASGRESEAI
jgi:hypothetical protein